MFTLSKKKQTYITSFGFTLTRDIDVTLPVTWVLKVLNMWGLGFVVQADRQLSVPQPQATEATVLLNFP